MLGINDILHYPPPVAELGPLCQVHFLSQQTGENCRPGAEDFEEDNAEWVDIGFLSQLLPHEVLRVYVPDAALHHRSNVRVGIVAGAYFR